MLSYDHPSRVAENCLNAWLVLVLLCLTVYRVTRLITRDQFPLLMWPREMIVSFLYPEYADKDWMSRRPAKIFKAHWGGFGRTVAYLLVCDWCMSVWVAAGVVTGVWAWTDWITSWVQAVMLGFAASTVTGWIASKEED